jgi:hypothetical protein
MDVSRKDIDQLHERMGRLEVGQATLAVNVGHLVEKLAERPRPCPELKDHLQEHKEHREMWQRSVVHGLVWHAMSALLAGLAAAGTVLLLGQGA